jgi:hypothetical protein
MAQPWEVSSVTELLVTVDALDVRWLLENSVAIGPGVMLPKRFVARASVATYDVVVEIIGTWAGPSADQVSVSAGGGGRSITSEILRMVPVGSIVSEAAKKVVWLADAEGGGVPGELLADVPASVKDQWPNGDLSVFLRFVGATYLVANALGEGPTAAVARVFGVSRATAGRYVESARKARLLPPAGGAPERVAVEDDPNGIYIRVGDYIDDLRPDEFLGWMEESFSEWSGLGESSDG